MQVLALFLSRPVCRDGRICVASPGESGIRRGGGNHAVINSLVRTFVEQHDSIESPRALRWKRHSGRTYIVLPVGDTGEVVRQAVDAFMEDHNWRRHFELVTLEGVD